MALDPAIQQLVEQSRGADRPALSELGPEQARNAYLLVSALSGPPADLAKVEDRTITPDGVPIRVRVYTPHGEGPFGMLVYFHGGGFTIGSIETHDVPMQHLAAQSGCVVGSVEYRLAPENPFPAAVDDCFAATAWMHEHAAELGADADRLAVGGDSAGGNLAAVVTHLAKDRGGPPIRFQLLVYPAVDAEMSFPSIAEHGDIPFLTEDAMRWFWSNYLGPDNDRRDPLVSPLHRRDLAGLPPALVITGEHDALVDEGEEYARRLQAAGVAVKQTRYRGMPHAFFQMAGIVEGARQAMAEAAAAVRSAVGSA